MLFDLVQRMPRRATDQVIKGLMRPVREAVITHSAQSGVDANAVAAVTASGMRSISLATAVGFLPSLQRYDQYPTLASISAKTIVISGGTDPTPGTCFSKKHHVSSAPRSTPRWACTAGPAARLTRGCPTAARPPPTWPQSCPEAAPKTVLWQGDQWSTACTRRSLISARDFSSALMRRLVS
jgi:hypothetical protein